MRPEQLIGLQSCRKPWGLVASESGIQAELETGGSCLEAPACVPSPPASPPDGMGSVGVYVFQRGPALRKGVWRRMNGRYRESQGEKLV